MKFAKWLFQFFCNRRYLWNSYTGMACLYLFTCGRSLGFDYAGWSSAPWCFLAFNASQIACFLLGSFFPHLIDYTMAHRHWAGNWPQAVYLLRKDASAKLWAAIPATYGQPPWDPIPPSVKSSGWLTPAGSMDIVR